MITRSIPIRTWTAEVRQAAAWRKNLPIRRTEPASNTAEPVEA
jgi:hypothetical protein